MSRPRRLNAPCPIILRTRGDGILAAACAVPDTPSNPVDSPATPGCGNDGSHLAGFSGYIGP
jgi:hypothetical protein